MILASNKFVLLAVLAGASSIPSVFAIVNGEDTTLGEFPYFIRNGPSCGGAVIAPDIILTAAHCARTVEHGKENGIGYTNLQMHMGAHEFGKPTLEDKADSSRFCERVILDPHYAEHGWGQDFALCKLNKPFNLPENIKLTLNSDSSLPEDDEMITQIGLGRKDYTLQRPRLLQKIQLPALSDEDCVAMCNATALLGCGYCDGTDNGRCNPYENTYADVKRLIVNHELLQEDGAVCHGGREESDPETKKGTCKGDSGSPFVKIMEPDDDGIVEHIHYGVMSWSLKPFFDTDGNQVPDGFEDEAAGDAEQCATKNNPSILARTSEAYDWIVTTMCNELNSISDLCDNDASDDQFELECDDAVKMRVVVKTAPGPYVNDPGVGPDKEGNPDYGVGEYELGFPKFKLPSWVLTEDASGDEVMERKYFFEDFTNEHELCLEEGKCYTWKVEKPYNDTHTGFAELDIAVNGRAVASISGGVDPDETVSICVPPCEDDPTFQYKGKNCAEHLKKNAKKKCNKKKKKKKVFEWCPKTCGEKAGLGACAWSYDA